MSIEKKTAVLVIHGVGPHMSFETCDAFVQGFCSTLMGKKQEIMLSHKLKQRNGSSPWIQSYVSFDVPGKSEVIDFYEYFWDIYMVHKPNFKDAFGMLIKASKSAHEFYKEFRKLNPELLVKGTDLGEFGRKRKFGLGNAEFKPGGYLKLLGPFFAFIVKVSPYVPFLLKVMEKWSETNLPIIKQAFGIFAGLMKEPVPDFVGDLVRYLDLDPRSERFEIRRKIINGAFEELTTLIRDDDYKNVFIAGHSLGSVIAYDALSRVIQEVNTTQITAAGAVVERSITKDQVRKIKGLITFGSPLDKIALFFHQRIGKNKKVQKAVLTNLRGFRSIRIDASDEDNKIDKSESDLKFKVENPIKTVWDDSIIWLNFYHKQDIISGKLDLYNLKYKSLNPPESDSSTGEMNDGNIEITEDIGKLAAHGCYWGEYLGKGKGTNQMQKRIIEEFFHV
jgi:hypothetical protein